MVYIIQFSHDDKKWFGYGADAIHPPKEFTEENANLEYRKVLANWHKPFPATYVRLVCGENVVRHDELAER